MKSGLKVENSGIRNEINRPINWAFNTVGAFNAFSYNFWDKYEEEDVIFSGVINYRDEVPFNIKKRSKYGTGVHYDFDVVEETGKYSYIPTSKNCFLKCCCWILENECIKFEKDLFYYAYKDFSLNQTNRKGVMTLARISKFNEMVNGCETLPYLEKKYNFIYVDNNFHFRPYKTKTNQSYALYLKDSHFCVVSVNKTQLGIQEINGHYKEVKTVISETN